ncbi:MAG: hypothetical protein Q9218_002600 [Villophora microphyllina]
MLQALRTASESYLEVPLADAEVVFPFSVSKTFLEMLRSTCKSLGVRLPRSAHLPAALLAVDAYANCDNNAERLVLTVDYSRAALTALLVYEDNRLFEIEREVHDTALGADALSDSPDQGRADLVRALHEITRLPLQEGNPWVGALSTSSGQDRADLEELISRGLQHSNGEGLTRISALVLIGDSAGDGQLQEVLKEVLSEQPDSLLKEANARRTGSVDPIFAAARGVAHACWDHLDYMPTGFMHNGRWIEPCSLIDDPPRLTPQKHNSTTYTPN